MKIKVLTLFPEMFESALHASILGRALKAGHLEIELIDIRDYAENRHRNTDDYPFGGGAGMVMMAQPVVDAVEKNAEPGMRRIYLSPRGRTWWRNTRGANPCSFSAATTRAWTSARWTWSSTRSSPSATMCSPAASWARWWPSTRSRG